MTRCFLAGPVPLDAAHRIASGLTSGSYTDWNGQVGRYYVVTAVNIRGESGPSNTAQAVYAMDCPVSLSKRDAPDGGKPALACLAAAPQAVTTPPAGQTWRSYYYAGGQRIAMRVRTNSTNVVYYLHSDHLGSASLTTDASGNRVGELRYTPYGETRYAIGAFPTDRRYTGQREEAGLGLYDYGARFYDPLLARFISADTIVPSPSSPQALNRYAYVLNSPLKYVDPTGHFTEQAIFDYLLSLYSGSWHAASYRLEQWKNDSEWWAMMSAARAGDNLCGVLSQILNPSDMFRSQIANSGFQFQFRGEGETLLTGITPLIPVDYAMEENTTLVEIQANTRRGIESNGWDWIAVVRNSIDNSKDTPDIVYSRYHSQSTQHRVTETEAWVRNKAREAATGLAVAAIPGGGIWVSVGKFLLGAVIESALDDGLREGDVQQRIGPAHFTLRFLPGKGWTQVSTGYARWYGGK